MEHPLPSAGDFPLARAADGPDATLALAGRAADLLVGGETILLWGPLGVGKTLFVQGLCRGLGVDDPEVVSPTFTLVNTYRGRFVVHHLDLYRLTREDDLHDIGLEALLEEVESGAAVMVVEWPHPVVPWLGDRLELLAEHGDADDARLWRLRGVPEVPDPWRALWEDV